MEHLKIAPNNDNKFIFPSDEPCVLPTWGPEESGKPPSKSPGTSPGESPNKTPGNAPGTSTGRPSSSEGASGPLLGWPGTQPGKQNGGAGTNYNRLFRFSSKAIQKTFRVLFLVFILIQKVI